jgi:protein-L-isoaspartate(D-aspartate) O-methyltransferase
VLVALAAVPRVGFVPPEHTDRADVDAPPPIPHGQVTTQPSPTWPRPPAPTAPASRTCNVVVGDGTEALPEHAPYYAIVVSAAFPEVPAPLAEQHADGVCLVQPIGHPLEARVDRRTGSPLLLTS